MAITSYTPETENAVPLTEGERVMVLDASQPDWWFVKKASSKKEGWVPSSYLQEEFEYGNALTKQLQDIASSLPCSMFHRILDNHLITNTVSYNINFRYSTCERNF